MKVVRWLAAVLLPCVFAFTAFAQNPIGGDIQARWTRVDASRTLIEGVFFNSSGAPVFVFDAELLGRDLGEFRGVAVPAPLPEPSCVPIRYLLAGAFILRGDGRVQVDACISLDLRPFGYDKEIVVGDLQGVLDPTPVKKPPSGTLRASAPGGWCPGGLRPLGVDVPTPVGGSSGLAPQPGPSARPKGHFHGRWRMT
ncbi:MAG: hypothetical protein IT454_09275 [Planctomycetes bacterium]|nr:hypothetical protein [Planctomycetota bacterium]